MSSTLPQPVSYHSLSLLRHPDRRTHWVSVVSATLAQPRPDAVRHYSRRLRELHAEVPILGARLRKDMWIPGTVAPVELLDGEPLDAPELLRPFALADEPPVRLVVGDGGRRLALIAHHAALDGRGQVAVLAALEGAPVPPPAVPPPPGPPESALAPLRRLLRPADAALPSPHPPGHDILLVRRVRLRGPNSTAKLTQACVDAVSARNARLGAPLHRIGISLGVGGPDGIGNVATYRRIDLPASEPVREAVTAALASAALPGEFLAPAPLLRLLSPIVGRFSDTLLVSNVGRCELPGAIHVENFPVARGRSAISFGCCGIAGHGSALSLRVRDLSRADAQALIDDAARRIDAQELASDQAPGPPRVEELSSPS